MSGADDAKRRSQENKNTRLGSSAFDDDPIEGILNPTGRKPIKRPGGLDLASTEIPVAEAVSAAPMSVPRGQETPVGRALV